MTKRGIKLARIRRMLGGGVPATGVTRVHRAATTPSILDVGEPAADTETRGGDAPEPGAGETATTTAVSLGVDDVHGRRRTVADSGSYKGVHRRVAA
ncbi:hypothetical protein ACIA8K_06580 [Catenuloplanes sp. NPDC051500]|uniref:hypothetical protein n=1 Tax=Catenuloplanes sp. NPDC051500 TaxID=3363959 RepID=UPI0037BBC280